MQEFQLSLVFGNFPSTGNLARVKPFDVERFQHIKLVYVDEFAVLRKTFDRSLTWCCSSVGPNMMAMNTSASNTTTQRIFFRDFRATEVSEEEVKLVTSLLDPLASEVWGSLAVQMYGVLRAQSQMHEYEDISLAQIAVAQVYQIAKTLGGDTIYLPMGNFASNGGRARALVNDYKSGQADLATLARRHGYTKARAAQILREYGLKASKKPAQREAAPLVSA